VMGVEDISTVSRSVRLVACELYEITKMLSSEEESESESETVTREGIESDCWIEPLVSDSPVFGEAGMVDWIRSSSEDGFVASVVL
jgi:hypothetical protein